jgi:hypothetical protein
MQLLINALRRSLLLLMLCFAVSVSAQLSLKSDTGKVCAGSAFLLTSSGGNGQILRYEKSYDGSKWLLLKKTAEVMAADNMSETYSTVYYRVTSEDGSIQSPAIAISQLTDNSCSKSCHQTSTGDFFQGTDFNPLSGTGTKATTIPDSVVSYFDDYSIYFSSGDVTDYHITSDLSNFLPSGEKPYKDSINSNYYMAVDQKNLNGRIAKLTFGQKDQNGNFVFPNPFNGKTYRYTMRFYISPGQTCTKQTVWNGTKSVDTTICSCDCDNNRWSQTQIIASTGHGTVSTDSIEAFFYDDAADTLIGSTINGMEGGRARFYIHNVVSDMTKYCGKLIRVEVAFYGTFPNVQNYDKYEFALEFGQFECSSAKIAIDYISAEVASVCMTHGAVCIGEPTTVRAAGFARNAKYLWEVYNDATAAWETLNINGVDQLGTQFETITITPKTVGKVQYRVRNMRDTVSAPLTFTVVAKDCKPAPIDSVVGEAYTCAPNSTRFKVVPIEEGTEVEYHWNLYNPKGEEITDPKVIKVDSVNRGIYATVTIPVDLVTYPEGDYLLRVYMTNEGLTVNKAVTDTLHVHLAPNAKFLLEGKEFAQGDSVCPSDRHLLLTATDQTEHTSTPEYIYRWTNASNSYNGKKVSIKGDSMIVDFGAQKAAACSNSLDSLRLGLYMKLKEDTTCYDSSFHNYKVQKEIPASIDCDALGDTMEVVLQPTDNSAKITLPIPTVIGTCDRNPTIYINVSGHSLSGADTSFAIVASLDSLKAGLVNRTFVWYATAGKKGSAYNAGLTAHYKAVDGCGKSDKECDLAIVIRDTAGPDIDCSSILSHTVHLANQAGCVAVPGYDVTELPVLTVPVLEDAYHPGTMITGTFVRSDGATSLNAPFAKGVTLITWSFADNAGNVSTCLQHITVYDNKVPETNCPDQTKFDDMAANQDVCYASLDSIVAQLTRQLSGKVPTAVDACTNATQQLTPVFYYRILGGGTTWTKADKTSQLAVGSTYEFQWRFYKLNPSGSAYVSDTTFGNCTDTITISDDQKPVFDCDHWAKKVLELTADPGKCDLNNASALAAINPAPVAKDNCGEITGTPKRMDGAAMTDPFPVGKTIIRWYFIDSNPANTDSCDQTLHVRTDLHLVTSCPDTITKVDAAEGLCSVSVNLVQQYAEHPCLTAANGAPLKIKGTAYVGSTKITEDAEGKLTHSFRVGQTKINWVFVDTTSTLIKSTDTCTQTLQVGNVNKMRTDCPDNVRYTIKKGCSIDASDLKFNDPPVVDFCSGETIIPVIYLISNPAVKVHDANQLGLLSVGKDTIVRIYTYKAEGTLSAESDTCLQEVWLRDTNNIMVNCLPADSVTVLKAMPGTCNLPMDSVLARLHTPQAIDSCINHPIIGVPSVVGHSSMPAQLAVGDTLVIRWTFHDPIANSDSAFCYEKVTAIGDQSPLHTACEVLQNTLIKVIVGNDICQKTLAASDLPIPNDTDICTRKVFPAEGYLLRTGQPIVGSLLEIGRKDTVMWIFTTPYTTAIDTCYQPIALLHQQPDFDCSSLKDLQVPVADGTNCTVDDVALLKALDALAPYPSVTEKCTQKEVKGVYGFAGGVTPASLKVGQKVTVTWTFMDSSLYSEAKICQQTLSVIDTTQPDLQCAAAVVKVDLSTGKQASYAQVQSAGLVAPVVLAECSSYTVESVRSDGKQLTDDYPADTVEVTWTVTDSFGNASVCRQMVIVTDQMDMDCPKIDNTSFACATAIPAPYTTYAEFKAAGGTVSDERKILTETFKVIDDTTGDNCAGMTVKRRYTIQTTTGKTAVCANPQVFTAKDDVPPVWAAGVSDSTLQFSCSDVLPDFPDLPATDNCSQTVTLHKQVTSSQGTDPDACDYYSYDIVCRYTAEDACGNQSTVVTYTYQVRDDQKPQINVSKLWSDSLIVATYLKNCSFAVPDVSSFLPKGAITDNCTDISALQIWQTPAVGDTIRENMLTPDTSTFMGMKLTRALYVYIYVKDRCGNVDSMLKKVYVPDRKAVVHLIASDISICAQENNPNFTLASTLVRQSIGQMLYYEDGEWINISSTFFFDYYRGSISPDNVVYSNNPFTYRSRFVDSQGNESTANRYNLTKLTRQSQSGQYYFVAMDTVTHCTDTAGIYIELKERPRVAVDSSLLKVCENDSIPLGHLSSDVCVRDMGAAITAEGWLLDDTPYKVRTLVSYSASNRHLLYYATNECGTTRSDSSLYVSCDNPPATTADSLAEAGSEARLDLWRKDELVINTSKAVEMHQRYNPSDLILTTYPQDKARAWVGDDVQLTLHTALHPVNYYWYKLNGLLDGRHPGSYQLDGTVKPSEKTAGDADDELLAVTDSAEEGANQYQLMAVRDSATYYVLISDSVCPAVASNLVSVDVLDRLPTAITPYTRDGLNDEFMKGHPVVIFNRYGQEIFEGNNGWNGYSRGTLVDPGVYFYEVQMNGGISLKGSIEVVKIE